jgi:hypothetical protein
MTSEALTLSEAYLVLARHDFVGTSPTCWYVPLLRPRLRHFIAKIALGAASSSGACAVLGKIGISAKFWSGRRNRTLAWEGACEAKIA